MWNSQASRRPRRSSAAHLNLESLEARLLLYSTTGGQWTFGNRITYSFAPDGTSIGGVPSAWYQSMSNRGFSPQTWKTEFRKAAAVWEDVANINLVEVPDNGAAFGVSGNQQGDSRFGDIRIGGSPQSSNVLGLSFLSPPYNGGTLAGDIVMNTNQLWQINSAYDIETVAIHEIGHALGLDHSAIASAVMYASYNYDSKQTLTTDDISGIQAIYGPRQPDRFDTRTDNDYYYRATNLTGWLDGKNQITMPDLDISGTYDQDWFLVTAPSNTTSTVTITMQSQYLSSLSPRFMVYTTSLYPVSDAYAVNSYGATITKTIGGVTPNLSFYVRTLGASNPSGKGSYALMLNFGTYTQPLVSPPNTVVPSQPDQESGSSNLQTSGPLPGLGLDPTRGNGKQNSNGKGHDKHNDTEDLPSLLSIGTLSAWANQDLVSDVLPVNLPDRPLRDLTQFGNWQTDPLPPVPQQMSTFLVGLGKSLSPNIDNFNASYDNTMETALDALLASWRKPDTPGRGRWLASQG